MLKALRYNARSPVSDDYHHTWDGQAKWSGSALFSKQCLSHSAQGTGRVGAGSGEVVVGYVGESVSHCLAGEEGVQDEGEVGGSTEGHAPHPRGPGLMLKTLVMLMANCFSTVKLSSPTLPEESSTNTRSRPRTGHSGCRGEVEGERYCNTLAHVYLSCLCSGHCSSVACVYINS